MTKKILLIALALPLALSAQKFYDDDPLRELPAPLRVEEVEVRKLNDYYDLFENMFADPGEEHPEPKTGEPRRYISAQAIDTLGEVINDPAWFVNRIGSREMSLEELVRGPGNDRPPSTNGKWQIVGAKHAGVTPGFRIKDSTGQFYLLKFDPLKNPEMSTGADVIGARFFHALGYSTPENYIVNFTVDQLEMGENVIFWDAEGVKERQMTNPDLANMSDKIPRDRDGRIRATASRFLSVRPVGEFRYYGTRSDDPNDIVPHEHRRDLRGLFVFAAWLNHNDSRAINNLDGVFEQDGLRYVKHYLIDFGAILGSASVLSNSARDGNAYFWEFKPTLAQIASVGLWSPRWARARFVKKPALGMIEHPTFEPELWKPNYPNPAFQNRLPDDEYWAAKKVMAFSDEAIAAIINEGQFSDSAATELLTDYLIKRRDRIGEVYFAKVLPLESFRIEAGQLKFEDLQLKHGLIDSRDYSISWSRFDNASEQHAAINGGEGSALPEVAAKSPAGAYFAAKIVADDPAKTVTAYLRKTSVGFEIVGLDRTW